jgi:[ribosomal protein S18]-alanine N-acetyltransferase
MPLIRPANPGDLLELERIEQRSFPMPHWRAENFLSYRCVVAEVDGKVAGFLVSRIVFPENEDLPAEREILNLAVDPAYRRRGIATALLRSELKHRGTHFLEVRESNVGARELYQKLGFKAVGRRPDYYSFPLEAAIVMQMKWC